MSAQEPRKRRKLDELNIRSKTNDLIAKFTKTLEALEGSDPPQANPLLTDASLGLLGMKQLQRQVLDKIIETQKTLDSQRKKRDQQELKLENLRYQKTIHQHSIAACQSLPTSQLLKLCSSEHARSEPDEKEDEQKVLKDFLGAEPSDPVQRAVILDKLNFQIRARKKLEGELKKVQLQASTLRKSLTSKRKLLHDLPLRLQDMERASLPLQKFCHKELQTSQRLGTEREQCLERAKTLPKALYTLFYQLQSGLDAMATSGELAKVVDPEGLPSLGINKDSTRILFQFPVPPISDQTSTTPVISSGFGGGPKLAVVSFSHDSELDVVRAESSTDHDMANLIDELFPGDHGKWADFEDAETTITDKTVAEGRPYYWCNYLAGVHLPPEEKEPGRSELRLSTATVIRSLLRRVRGQATLRWILNALSRKPNPIPVHPDMKSTLQSNTSVKLVSWSPQTSDSSSSEDIFDAVLKKKSSTLYLRVQVNVARYPSLPPTWQLSSEPIGKDALDESSRFYDKDLATLQHHVNDDFQDFVVAAEETSYNWILSHQLATIVSGWEAVLARNDSS